ncbi:TolC family protein [uncultured Dialister sp.]|uniref:TolC family protein n=1 Tax=uncultured Dialister sp. TaxID=278064 RepID=UPI0025E1808B|nr:TolC family protein [uncultured Dialister sp.]
MNKYTYRILAATVVMALSLGVGAEAKGSVTRTTTDPSITEKALAAQMNQVSKDKTVNFNNMLIQKNLADSLGNVVAPEASNLDIDLRGAVTTAIKNNRDITIADLQRKEAEAAVSQAAAAKNPSVSYSWTGNQFKTRVVSATTGAMNNRSYSQGVNVSFPIWTGGNVEGQINEARYNKNIADVNYYMTEADTKLSAVKAYYTWLEDIKLAEVQDQSVSDYASHLNNVQQQFDAGIVAKLDVLTSNVSLANAKQSSIAAHNARDVAEANLNNIMRIPMNTKLNPLDKDFPEPDFDITMDQAILMAQKYRWELIKADYNVRIANEQLRVARSGYMPTFSVGGGYNWDSAAISKIDKDDWALKGTASWNIWDGGATQAKIKSAKEAIKVAQEDLLKARETVELEVRQDYLNILAYKEQIRATEAAVAEAEEAYKIATVRYQSGVGINLDVLDAELQLNTARTNYITALYNYNIGLATLEHAMGIPAVIHPEFAKAGK